MFKKTIFCLLSLLMGVSTIHASETPGDTLFFSLTDGTLMAFPREYVASVDETKNYYTLTLTTDTTVVIAKQHIVSLDSAYTDELPRMLSYKFNNKFNDQLYTDAFADIDSLTGRITAQVGCIGKRLTPSFQLTEGAEAYVDGRRQHSKQSRMRFDTVRHYTVAYPGQFIYKQVKVKDEIWSTPEEEDSEGRWKLTPLELTADLLDTNAPSNYGENPDMLIDGDPATFYQSTWGNGAYTPLAWYYGSYYGDGYSEWPYLQIQLPETLSQLKFAYTTRQSDNRAPTGLLLQGSVNGQTWTDVQTFTAEKDGLPALGGTDYESPVIPWNGNYRFLRLQMTAAQYKNYFNMAELTLYKAEEDPDWQPNDSIYLIAEAEYQSGFFPFGREYDVHVDFLTDHPTSEYNVPRIDIWFGDNTTWSSSMWIGRYGKDFFEDATIKIDGAGVFPDMAETAIQIKGRGNSSWSNSYDSKNPYRIKFPEKQKPFGLTAGKNWVLLSNKQSGSMTTNALAMKIADMVGTEGCNHIIPVELYVNDQYRGSYNFTEKVGFSNNSIDLPDETNAVLLELDTYYDEAYKFRDATYNLHVNIKEPEFNDPETITNLTADDIEYSFNYFTSTVSFDGGASRIDVNSFVRAMLVNDLVRNEECKHPKSWFLYNPNVAADSLYHFGPVWDFDWAFGYEGSKTYFIRGAETDLFSGMSNSNLGYPFFKQLFRGSDTVKKAYYRLWTEFINSGKLDELIEYCDDYFQYVEPSFLHNQDGVDAGWWTYWGDGNQYESVTTNAKNWLTKRANYIYTHLTKYDLDDDIIDDEYAQPDAIDMASVSDRLVDVFTLQGILVRKQVPRSRFHLGLMPGIYIVDGEKILIR